MMHDCLAEHWTHVCRDSERATVVPDGCQDVILRLRPDAPASWSWFALADRTTTVRLEGGCTLHGFRLLPGTRFRRPDLAGMLAATRLDPTAVEAVLREETDRSPAVAEALSSLAEGRGSVAEHARRSGLSDRSLHRLIATETGRPPVFWLGLARARRSARALAGAMPLAEIAADHGWSDQAHMSRALRHWFGATPTALAKNIEIARLLEAPAYA